ncbi:MAG: OmpA family protein [Flavobacteriales bacterium]|nr:OmpA family protein [Flavobacteriales bacterium]
MYRTLIIITLALCVSSCVSKKVYTDLQSRYTAALDENERLSRENQENKSSSARYKNLLESANSQLADLRKQYDEKQQSYLSLKNQFNALQSSYLEALKNKENLMDASSRMSREYADNLRRQQSAIDSLSAELTEREKDLRSREARVAQLENMIGGVQAKLASLKNELMKALVGYEGKGLTITQRNGKIYISLENRLLFPSGSWQVNSEGRRAIDEISQVLVSRPDIKIMVEGHTDDVPYKTGAVIKDNWDLSVMRATSIVRLITAHKGINPQNITAAGRSQYEPLLPNTNADNRSRNRRTEVIITPDLASIERMLQDIEIE